jgi:hypothetical protein
MKAPKMQWLRSRRLSCIPQLGAKTAFALLRYVVACRRFHYVSQFWKVKQRPKSQVPTSHTQYLKGGCSHHHVICHTFLMNIINQSRILWMYILQFTCLLYALLIALFALSRKCLHNLREKQSLSITYSVRLLNSKDSPCLGDVPRPAVISDLALRLQGVQRTHWNITRRRHPISMSWEYLQEQNKAMVSHSWECDAISYFNPAWWLEKDCLALPFFHPSPALLSCGKLLESACPSY